MLSSDRCIINYTSIEIAIPSTGQPFEVEVVKHLDGPSVVICDGQGINCPFQHQLHASTACVLQIPTVKGLVFLCGKVGSNEADEGDS